MKRNRNQENFPEPQRDAAAQSGASVRQEIKSQRQGALSPWGAIVFFAVAAEVPRLAELLLNNSRWEYLTPMVVGSGFATCLLVIPLAYTYYPQVFTKRFWHFPGNSAKWILSLAVLHFLLLPLGGPPPGPIPKWYALGSIVLAPLVEEVVRAVLISPLIERWGTFWGVAITGTLTSLVHPVPLLVVIPVFAQTIMFVATDRSIPATALAHSVMNGIVVVMGAMAG